MKLAKKTEENKGLNKKKLVVWCVICALSIGCVGGGVLLLKHSHNDSNDIVIKTENATTMVDGEPQLNWTDGDEIIKSPLNEDELVVKHTDGTYTLIPDDIASTIVLVDNTLEDSNDAEHEHAEFSQIRDEQNNPVFDYDGVRYVMVAFDNSLVGQFEIISNGNVVDDNINMESSIIYNDLLDINRIEYVTMNTLPKDFIYINDRIEKLVYTDDDLYSDYENDDHNLDKDGYMQSVGSVSSYDNKAAMKNPNNPTKKSSIGE